MMTPRNRGEGAKRRSTPLGNKPKPVTRWGLEWSSENELDGKRRWIVMRNRVPVLFKTRREARAFQQDQYGFIARRRDLRTEPHGWSVPRVVRIECRVAP